MTEQAALRLFRGHTTHQRSVPFTHRFKYSLSLIELDVDRLDDAARQSSLFSIDKPNLFSFRRRDHGERKDKDLRQWAERHFIEAGIDLEGGAVRLLTFPRHLFYKFAPISLWMGYGPDGELRGILYEVNNTFGETHTYVAPTPEPGRHRHLTEKVFHVSPFFDISGTYRFTLRVDGETLGLVIETLKDGAQTHLATIKAEAYPATTPQFARLAITKPFSSFGVTLAIHWQALKLWLKGAKYHSKPKQSSLRTTIAQTEGAATSIAPIRETAA